MQMSAAADVERVKSDVSEDPNVNPNPDAKPNRKFDPKPNPNLTIASRLSLTTPLRYYRIGPPPNKG